MLGATENEEMAQFYIVNSKAKSVRTDLALELLKQLTERNPEMMEALTERERTGRSRHFSCPRTGRVEPRVA